MIKTTSYGFLPKRFTSFAFKPPPVTRLVQSEIEGNFGGEFDDVIEGDYRIIVTDYALPIRIIWASFDSRFGGCNVSLRWNGNLVTFEGGLTTVAAPVGDPVRYNCSQFVPAGGDLTLDIFDVNPLFEGSEIVDWNVVFLRHT